MSGAGLDPLIHAPTRLQLCALLSPLEEAEFRVLRDELRVSDSVLSKQIRLLEDAGYVGVRKAGLNGRQRTWARLTPSGRRAFAAHVTALQALASAANTAPSRS